MSTTILCTPTQITRRVDDYDLGYSDALWDRPMKFDASERYRDGYCDALADIHVCPDIDEDEIPF